MAQQFSFDIVSKVDLQEIDNAVNQAIREVSTRFDFKGTKSSIEFSKTDARIRLIADDDMKLRNLQDILKTRVASRKISIKALKFGEAEEAFQGTLRQDISLIAGIPQEKAKNIVKIIKDGRYKAQASIQGEEVRVSSKSKDILQDIMGALNKASLDIPLQFTNFR